ncbi:DNA alkylation repair protein [Candidatus Falkowbacteria bacterium]|jgi:3-methyladenine DNA glycosylase AlkD|nr:DNA alkylation repair protein [Candidatus Falkowbacteria bacterium]MBT4432827.1 DNA alkylation repair protein [Candidatus Falkowbacteria bacterium]
MNNVLELKKELKSLANSRQAKILQGFFKTGKGQYGEGDIFLGIKVPIQRKIAIKYKTLLINDIQKLLNNKIHEERLIALFILIHKYKIESNKEKIYKFYLKNTKNINNWDLVDLSAPKIVGDYLLNKKRNILYELVKSKNLWDRRIAILSTFTFIRNNDFKDTIKISKILLKDEHDLIHKAVGWMLREMGKRNEKELKNFLDKHYKKMPRTMLRYSLEKLNEKDRKHYMKK